MRYWQIESLVPTSRCRCGTPLPGGKRRLAKSTELILHHVSLIQSYCEKKVAVPGNGSDPGIGLPVEYRDYL